MISRYDARRFWLLATVFAVACTVLLGRLAWIQIVRGAHWKETAQNRSSRVVSRLAPRGRILDRDGRVLAVTEIHTDVGLSPKALRGREPDYEELARVLDRSPDSLRRRTRNSDQHVVLAQDRVLAPDERLRLERMAGVTLQDQYRRRRPHGDLARRLLGTVSVAGEGSSGLEAAFEHVLAGEPGRELVRYDRSSRVRSSVPLEAPVAGADLSLTVDVTLQSILESELEITRQEVGAHRAQGIILDPRNGEVLALAQVPLRPEPVEGLEQANPYRVMAATDLFEPGSSFKVLTMASLLSRAVADTATLYDGMGHDPDAWRSVKVFEDGQRLHDTHPVGVVSLGRAFTLSSNIVFGTAVGALRRDEFEEDLRRMGLGRSTGTPLPHEESGILRDPQQWSAWSQRSLAIGHEVSLTLLQMSSAYAALLGDGHLRSPRLALRWRHPDGHVEGPPSNLRRRTRVVPPHVIPTLRALCRQAVADPEGTGGRAAIEGLDVGGKTGTAQVSLGRKGYLEGVYTPNFFGIVPARDPRLLVGIVLHRVEDREVSGGGAAAPVFERVVRRIACSTRWLDAAIASEVSAAPVETVPDLVGREVGEVYETAAESAWRLAGPRPGPGAVAVGQIPLSGTRADSRTPIRVVWMEATP